MKTARSGRESLARHSRRRCEGMVTVLVTLSSENVDARQHVLDMCPDAESELVERSWSSDDLEIGFAVATRKCGANPQMCDMIGCLGNIEFLTDLRRNSDRGFTLVSAAHSKYSHHTASEAKLAKWNDGLKLAHRELMQKHLDKKQKKAVFKALGRERSTRSHFDY